LGTELRPDVIKETAEKVTLIRSRILAAQSRQKSYADQRHRSLEFQVGDFVILKASPMKSVRRFGQKGKLAPRYVGPFRVSERIIVISLDLSCQRRWPVCTALFHISMWKKHLQDAE
jgi:hypothetical protein